MAQSQGSNNDKQGDTDPIEELLDLINQEENEQQEAGSRQLIAAREESKSN